MNRWKLVVSVSFGCRNVSVVFGVVQGTETEWTGQYPQSSVSLSRSLSLSESVCRSLLSLSLGFPLGGRLNQRLDRATFEAQRGPFPSSGGGGREGDYLVGTGIIVGFDQLEGR
ncbi:hypothetical protein LX32DRAFT_379484 [Colletotrichum zoysiae]|uniref:Uncharacterized protein n=1 Tax=Colletotrichum zoysiae TaxID=1216348 RepID=A0AAD9M1B0_9PEZI|nr:hypothetical protein LX32DRAFT_379484 [Colletotrichum zoysiae]